MLSESSRVPGEAGAGARGGGGLAGMTRGVVKRDPPRAGLLNYQQNIVRLREYAPLITFYSLWRIISKSDEI